MSVEMIGHHSIRWPDELRGPWLFTLHWAKVGERAELVGFEIRSFRPDPKGKGLRPVHRSVQVQPISSTLLRKINLAELVREQREVFGDVVRYVASTQEVADEERAHARENLIPLEAASRRHDWWPVDHFDEVARIYSDANLRGDFPTKAVADHFKVARSTAAKWVVRARKLKLLGDAPAQRKAGGSIPAPDQRRRK